VQQAFIDNDAQQCGFCTPGFVVACKAFLDQHPHPSDDDIRRGLSGNLCRCGTYDGIRRAIQQVSGGARATAVAAEEGSVTNG
jgi:aerobic-type carbon monoxide dehydrogenase small subunit (CoxS/CutS family)